MPKIPDGQFTLKETEVLKLLPSVKFNLTQAVKQVYNCSSSNSASSIATRLKKRLLKVNQSLAKQLVNEDIDPEIATDPKLGAKLTPHWILTQLLKVYEGAKTARDKSHILELLGKYKELSLFREHTVNEEITAPVETAEELTQEFRELINTNKGQSLD